MQIKFIAIADRRTMDGKPCIIVLRREEIGYVPTSDEAEVPDHLMDDVARLHLVAGAANLRNTVTIYPLDHGFKEIAELLKSPSPK